MLCIEDSVGTAAARSKHRSTNEAGTGQMGIRKVRVAKSVDRRRRIAKARLKSTVRL